MSERRKRQPLDSVDRGASPSDSHSPAVRLAEGERATKRRKTRLACDECRSKKTKCDGAKPLCGACKKKGWPEQRCIYNDTDRKDWAGMRQLVEQLQGRIRSLEHENAAPFASQQSQISVSRPPQQQHPVLTQSECSQLLDQDEGFSPMQAFAVPNQQVKSYRQGAGQFIISPEQNENPAPRDIPLTLSGIVDATSNVPERDDFISGNDRPDAVSAIVGAVTGEQQTQGFHGTSSAATFMQQIREAINARVGVPSESEHDWDLSNQLLSQSGYQQRSSAGFTNTRVAPNYVLPPRKLADDLSETYWTYVYPLYPFLDKRSFMESYNRIWTGDWTSAPFSPYASGSSPGSSDGNNEHTAVCIFYMVLALACQYSNAVDEESRRDTAKSFFLRAKNCLQFDPMDSSNHSIYLVQAFLLFGQYLQGIGRPHEAWGAIGVATRICHELGFHRTQNTTVQHRKERETIKHVYHGCVMIDRMLSMTLGRPPMVSVSLAESVSLPTESDDDWYEVRGGRSGQTSGRASEGPSILSFFRHSVKLYNIMHKILLSFYSDENIASSDDADRHSVGLESALHIEQELSKWCRSIPDHLKMNPFVSPRQCDEQPPMFSRLGYILWARFLHVRIYLLRPIFARFCIYSQVVHSHHDQEPGMADRYAVSEIPPCDMISYRMALQCSILCVKSARELIAVICKQFAVERSCGRKPSWLFSVLHVYLAAAVLIAIRLRPDIPWEVTEQEIEESWTRALEILRDYQTDSRSAQRCVAALEFLHEKLPGISQYRQAQQEQRNWQNELPDFETHYRHDEGDSSLDGAGGAWNWDFQQTGWEDFVFLDPLNVL